MTDARSSWSCAYLQVSIFWRPRPSAEATPAMSIYRKGLVSIALLWYGAALACMLERGKTPRLGAVPKESEVLALLCGHPGQRLAAAVLRHRSTALSLGARSRNSTKVFLLTNFRGLFPLPCHSSDEIATIAKPYDTLSSLNNADIYGTDDTLSGFNNADICGTDDTLSGFNNADICGTHTRQQCC